MTDNDIKEFAAATKGLWPVAPDLAPRGRVDVSDPPFLPPRFTNEQKLFALEREISIRRRVYPNRVLTRRMSQKFADEQIAVLVAIADDYRKAG